VTFTGKFYLPQVLLAIGKYLTYRWTLASIWNGDADLVHPLDFSSQWKPVLTYSKGEWVKRGRWLDVLRVNSKENNWHPWQQPLAEVESLLSFFTQPGDLVIDPCGGAFTNAEACLRLGRRCASCDADAGCVSNGLERLERAGKSMTLDSLPQ
jgi:site-specific DNA-methyltransferase (adenine-specific)